MRTAAVVVVLGLVVAACGSSHEVAVEDAARAFSEALASDDLERACFALAPSTVMELEDSSGQQCPRALQAQDVVTLDRVSSVERFGRQASVAVEGADGQDDTWFLSRFDGRWLLVAASCTPRAQLPYACELEGP